MVTQISDKGSTKAADFVRGTGGDGKMSGPADEQVLRIGLISTRENNTLLG
ncbi:hypothetical protein [Blastopirellula retiformator]|uniref:Uncharacterized protein n=1 Tax=Blastopirellula retiformator TaxID=2527970 RepID=A0A5C5VP87_9BACT|nr:hypothetical protein [Blastopirellula retiformator]TWT39631.1 hypothetical protein Enr8_13310 [Blastopirellula retiformator]